jgi:XTP/dITP diphosphohydrolase
MLTIVTGNTGKYDQILAQFPRKRQVNQVDLDLSEIQTNILTVISADKCKRAYEQLEQPVLVDDTGIYFDAFDRFPGAFTKFLYQ